MIGADALSRYVDWTDRGTCILFGDAAGAVLVQVHMFVNKLNMSFLICRKTNHNSVWVSVISDHVVYILTCPLCSTHVKMFSL